MPDQRTRIIYYGDNLDILRQHIATESVDLVYLDPPFKSQQEYNLLFRTVKGEPAAAQVRAFSDTWRWDMAAKATYERLVQDPRVPGRVSSMVEAFYKFLGPSEMMAYLVMMTPRLLELHRVLKPTGSLYLHCDPAASHYLKIVLDCIFGPRNFRREIVWRSGWVSGFKSAAKNWIRNHDILLYYLRDARHGATFNLPYKPHPPGYQRRGGTGANPKGVPLDDVWIDIYSPAIMSFSKEKLGYQTQKPLALLERIIQASSNPGDLVLDPFCGCGTALVAAEKLGRSWIGIDITYLAVDVMARRLRDHFPGIQFAIKGDPQDVEGARALAERDRFQFQVWAISRLGGQPLDPDRPGADRGIDGYLPFRIYGDKVERAIIQVKSGHVGVKDVRDLRGTLEREKAPFAILLTLEPPTRDMQREAVDTGFYQAPATQEQVPRLQILTIGEVLEGKRPSVPTLPASPVLKAARLPRREGQQMPLPSERGGT